MLVKTIQFLVFLCLTLMGCADQDLNRVEQKQSGTDPVKSVEEKVSIAALQAKAQLDRENNSPFKFEEQLADNVFLYSYLSDGLKLFTMVNRPLGEEPGQGHPVVIFGHGFHPDPPKYGISNSTGENWRPGDYYRGIPAAYAKHGFLTITPDYRGHNISEGIEYTQSSYLASSYYARDVLSLLARVETLEGVDMNRIYYMGHSMGVDVGLKVVLASNAIRAASLWSGVISSTPQQVLYYGKSSLPEGEGVDAAQFKAMRSKIDNIYAQRAPGLTYADIDPVNYLSELELPLLVQHGMGDKGAPYLWSESFVTSMLALQKDVTFYFYDTDEHLFSGAIRAEAVQRDVDFFNAH